MKTKIKLIGILISTACLIFISISGCGSAGPSFESVEQYESGKWEDGWLYDMDAEAVKKLIDGMTDSERQKVFLEMDKTTLEYYKNNYHISENNTNTVKLGTIAVRNEMNQNIDIGAEKIIETDTSDMSLEEIKLLKLLALKMSPSWYVGAKTTEYHSVPPGTYRKWFSWKGKKKYAEDLLIVGLQTSFFLGKEVSGKIIVK